MKQPQLKMNLLTQALFASTLSAALLSGTAFAAQQAKATDPAEAEIEKITVTGQRDPLDLGKAFSATRTPTPLEKIPQSVQILPRDILTAQDLQTLSDAMQNVSGVTPSSTMQTVLFGPALRGFGTSYFFDGMPAYQLPSGASDPATLINVERIEVVKGPANTLYGGGSGAPLSGLINVVSRDPGTEPSTELELRAGSYQTYGVQGRISTPLTSDLAVSLAGMLEQGDSYIDAVDSSRYALYPTLAWQISDKTRLTVRGQYNHLEQQEYSGLPVALVGKVKATTFAGAEDAADTEVDNAMLTATLTHHFDASLQGDLSLRHYHGEFAEYATFPLMQMAGTVYAFGSGIVPSDIEQQFMTASLLKTFSLAGFKHQLLAGFDYDKTDYYGAMGLNFAWAMIDYANRSTNPAFGTVPAISDEQNDDMITKAAFVQDQITLTDRLDVTASLRFSQLAVESSYVSGGMPFVDTDEDYSKLSPRLGATYRLADGVFAFVGYAEGFKGLVAAFGVPEPKPETSQSYEAGLKLTDVVPGLSGTFSVFDIVRQNVITADPANPFQSIQTGEQRSKGYEADLMYRPEGSAVTVLFNYGRTDAEVSKDNALPVGDALRAIPKHKGRLALTLATGGAALLPDELGAGVTVTSSRELTLPNTTQVAGNALFDLQADWRLAELSLGLSVQNLTDRDSFEPYQYFGGQYVIPVQPRSVTLRLRTAF